MNLETKQNLKSNEQEDDANKNKNNIFVKNYKDNIENNHQIKDNNKSKINNNQFKSDITDKKIVEKKKSLCRCKMR